MGNFTKNEDVIKFLDVTFVRCKFTMENTPVETIEAYCDGACKKNPGKGGWGCVYFTKVGLCELRFTRFGGKMHTTNQEMELTAMCELLKLLPVGGNIKIYPDSTYVLGGLVEGGKHGFVDCRKEGGPVIFTGWIGSWKRNGWKKKDGKQVLHLAIWQEIALACELHVKGGSKLEFQWVAGHSGNEGNDLADLLSNMGVP